MMPEALRSELDRSQDGCDMYEVVEFLITFGIYRQVSP